jgi:RNA recognition motif-containing protein
MPKRIFIGSLSLTTTDVTVSSTFSPYGIVVSASINRNAAGQSLGTAVVEYTTDQAGTNAIAAKNRTVLDGNTITVQ